MATNNYQGALSSFVCQASGSANSTYTMSFDLEGVNQLRLGISMEIAGTLNASSGGQVIIKSGFGDKDPSMNHLWFKNGTTAYAVFDSEGETGVLNTPKASNNKSLTTLLVFVEYIPRWLEIEFQNTDTTNANTFTVYGDI